MIRMMLTAFGAVIALALASAVVMVASTPPSMGMTADRSAVVASANEDQAGSDGRLILSFEPASEEIDRN